MVTLSLITARHALLQYNSIRGGELVTMLYYSDTHTLSHTQVQLSVAAVTALKNMFLLQLCTEF